MEDKFTLMYMWFVAVQLRIKAKLAPDEYLDSLAMHLSLYAETCLELNKRKKAIKLYNQSLRAFERMDARHPGLYAENVKEIKEELAKILMPYE